MSSNLSAEQIFNEACELESAERKAYLDDACGDDSALRSKVEALLQADADAGSFLAGDTEAADPDATIPRSARRAASTIPAEQRGQMIGRYKLLEQIGEGGFVETLIKK